MTRLNEVLEQLSLDTPVAIIGAGVTGLSCFHLLNNAAVACDVFDERETLPSAFADYADRVTLGAFTAESFEHYGTILLSPGVDTRRACFAAHEDKLLTDMELFARLVDKPVVGVTGSNGKSTVVTLLHQATQQAGLNYQLCGNIGLPVLQALQDCDDNTDGFVVELSSYHLERSPSLRLAVGVWLNVSPDHLDRYESYAHYIQTKATIFERSATIVANANDAEVIAFADNYTQKKTFSVTGGNADYCLQQQQIMYQGQLCFSMQDFPQMGQHYAENVMAVFAAADTLGIDRQAVATACRKFVPLPYRSVVVGKKNGVIFINDSKGTNVGATVAAISGIDTPIILLAGGQGKGQDFSTLATAAKGRVKAFVLLGEDKQLMQRALSTVADCVVVDTLEQAVTTARQLAKSGDVVMLSPACASFDMFDSYLRRGEAFDTLVKEWINE